MIFIKAGAMALFLTSLACSSESDLSGSSAKKTTGGSSGSRDKDTIVETPVATAPAGPSDAVVEEPSKVKASTSAGDTTTDLAPPDWAALVDVACTWDGMEADKIVTIRCEMVRTDGQPIPVDAEIPVSWELKGPDGQLRAGASFKDDPARAGLNLGFGDFVRKVVQFVTAPVETIAQDVLHIKLGGGLLAKVFELPIFKRIPVLKDGVDLGLCLATATFPAFCFAKFGIAIADRIAGGMARAGDGRALLAIHQYRTPEGRHGYLPPGAGPPWIDEGPAFFLIRDELPGTAPLVACQRASGTVFVSQFVDTCEGATKIGPIGRFNTGPHQGAVAFFRCYRADVDDQLTVANPATCAEAGYVNEGVIGYMPLPDYTH